MARGSEQTEKAPEGLAGPESLPGETGTLDKSGTATVTKKFVVQSADDLGKAPDMPGFRVSGISYTKLLNNFYEQTVTYQAAIPGDGSPIGGFGGAQGFFEIFCSFEIKPIELHPRILDIASRYNGYFTEDQRCKFPPYISDAVVGALSAGRNVVNPMFGMTHYKEPTFTLRHTYNTRSISASLFAGTGQATNSLPGGLNFLPPSQNGQARRWLIQAPSASLTGSSWRIQQEYVLLDARGVADEIFLKQ